MRHRALNFAMKEGSEFSKAFDEGRRNHIGNIRYVARPEDIGSFLQAHGLSPEKIHLSVDPISARNPGYCFVELPTAEDASEALTSLNVKDLFGRPVNTGACVAKNPTTRHKSFERSRYQKNELERLDARGRWRGTWAHLRGKLT